MGVSLYSGEVATDSNNGNKIPNGKGKFEVTAGEYKGNIYEGHLVNGNMEGSGFYRLSNGDTFKGTFKDNKYHEGRYTIKKTGEYFEGYFKDGSPDKGQWYNKNGEKI